MSRTDRLPPPLRPLARAVRRRLGPGHLWDGDGYGTNHLSPFVEDAAFDRAWRTASAAWFDGDVPDVRWRLWILTCCARSAQHLDGAFAEFGTFRGGCAFMVLDATETTPLWLYDTFAGLPGGSLADAERTLEGRYAQTDAEQVAALLRPWSDRIRIVAGDVFDTVPAHDPGPLALAHLDLNAAAPTEHVLDFVYDRVVPAGMLVFDDYGWAACADQRASIDRFFADRPETVVALPTGQALVVKLPTP